MKRNLAFILLCVVLAISLIACDTAGAASDVSKNENITPEASKMVDGESTDQGATDNGGEVNLPKSDTLKMSIDFSLISEDAEVTALEVEGTYDSVDNGSHASEYEPWSIKTTKSFNNASAARDAVISFFGKTVNCEYKKSKKDLYYNFAADEYKGTHNGYTVSFKLHPETGEVIEFFDYAPQMGDMPVEEAQNLAAKIASAYIDINDYSLAIDSNDVVHTFVYTRMVGDFPTAEKLTVSIETDGQLLFFRQNMIGTFDLTEKEEATISARLEKLALPNAKNALEAKIESIYPNYEEYEVYDSCATVLEDGSIAMVYNLGVMHTKTPVEENGETVYLCMSSRVFIILK